ncbi:MAG: metallophosphoesterase family protein [Chloroflexota bacterium]
MSTIRFIHCSDLHLDSPFRGLSNVNAEVSAALNEATFRAWENIVDLAISEQVDFVVIAGDIYDSRDRSLRAQLRFRDGMKRLSDACIPSFIAFGNHDPLNGWSNSLEWPREARFFGAREVDSCEVYRNGYAIATVHGISFAREDIRDDLAARFVSPERGLPSIAVLHCNVGSNTGHEPYAPTSVEELSSKGFAYWALGHVHAHRVIRRDAPAIVYPGCSQSRHPNETGAKGCCLVTLNDFGPPDVDFVATDTVRYFKSEVDISGCSSIDAVRESVTRACTAAAESAEGRYLVGRVNLMGRTPLQGELSRGDTVEQLMESIRTDLLARERWVWLERLSLLTHAPYDIAELRQQQDFAGDIVRTYTSLLDSDNEELARLKAEIEKDITRSTLSRLIEPVTEEEFRQLAEQAMHRTLDLVLEDD